MLCALNLIGHHCQLQCRTGCQLFIEQQEDLHQTLGGLMEWTCGTLCLGTGIIIMILGQWTLEMNIWPSLNCFQIFPGTPQGTWCYTILTNSVKLQQWVQIRQKKIQSANSKMIKKLKLFTGESWGLEVGEGHNLWGSLGQLVLSNINCLKC